MLDVDLMLEEVNISRDVRCYVLVRFQSNLILLVFFSCR
jgi:hypothetical protein